MANLVVVRHGRAAHNVAGTLAGRAPDIQLDAVGLAQAAALGERLAGVKFTAVVCSPILRCRQTLETLMTSAGMELGFESDERFTEVDYGDWTGRGITDLEANWELWSMLQHTPSRVAFAGGEPMQEVHDRVVAGVRDWNHRVGTGTWLLVSHGDPVKALIADALGVCFDDFQRIVVDPAAATIIEYPESGSGWFPMVLGLNLIEGAIGPRIPKQPVRGGQIGGGLGAAGMR